MVNWSLIEKKINEFISKYKIKQRYNHQCSLEINAALLSYKTSVNLRDHKHVIFGKKYSTKQRNKFKNYCLPLLVIFLKKRNFTTTNCIKLMEKLKKTYVKNGVINYTFGNAQKWVNACIKYYFILNVWKHCNCNAKSYWVKSGFTISPLIFGYELFPVDTTIINTFKKLLKINFLNYSNNYSWHNCNNVYVFKKYWSLVAKQMSLGYTPILYEIENF